MVVLIIAKPIAKCLLIADSFKKIVVTKDHIKLKRDENGIVTMSIYDFLLKSDSLDL